MSITVNDLIRGYTTNKLSPYHKLRYKTRGNYDSNLRRIADEPIIAGWMCVGHVKLADLWAMSFLTLHAVWSQDGKHLPMAHGIMSTIRVLVNFGVLFLRDKDCGRLAGELHALRFPMGDARDQVLTVDQIIALRAAAHKHGLAMIALAQAIQFEGTFRQKDIIGEYVPLSEPGVSDVMNGEVHELYQRKWLRGIRWNEIDGNLILRHITSKKNKLVEVDLKLAPMAMDELQIAFCDLGEPVTRARLPASGPVIVDPDTGLPFLPHKFRRLWRALARECDIPDEIQQRDTRATAITEATDSGVELETVRHAAAHSNVSMTARYSRNAAKKTAETMKRRAAHRARNTDQDEVA